jgi:hypothetical protein
MLSASFESDDAVSIAIDHYVGLLGETIVTVSKPPEKK